jgi:citrate synthase
MNRIDQRIQYDQYQSAEHGDADSELLTAREAAALLGVKLPTLYAYTSRGLIRSLPGGKGRARRYLRADLERLRARRDARAGHGAVAAGALRWGEPVLDTALTAISRDRGPLYRGVAAIDLAERGVRYEAVAELLWSGADPVGPESATRHWIAHEFPVPLPSLRRLIAADAPPLAVLQVVVPLLGSRDPGRFVETTEAVAPRARTLIRRMAAALAPGGDEARIRASFEAETVAGAVAAAMGAGCGEEGVRAVDRALVLAADHELNASTFAARVVASTGADVYACVSAALAALSGPRHGGATGRIEALLAEIDGPEDAERVVNERARRGEAVEGFGHPLYPRGDPRANVLLELARSLAPRSRPVRTCLALVEAMHRGGRGGVTIDVGLVALCAALGVPDGSALGLFAVSRCAGWVAHALEQYAAGYLVRPRARYLAQS